MHHTTSHSTDYRQLDDPALLEERARVRTELEHTPAHAPDRQALSERAALLDAEFAARAGHALTTHAA